MVGPMAISFQTHPDRYNHWNLGLDGPVATLTLDIAEDKPLVPGYKLKLNSYDLGVDIELNDAVNRIRFEHPEVKSVVITSGKSRMFCSGANIYMLGHSSHAWKVNFCKYTNETRNSIEEASAGSGLKFIAALNGTTAGGGYGFARSAFGPWGGFLTGTAILIEYAIAPAAIAVFIGAYCQSLFGIGGWMIYLAFYIIFIAIHIFGVGEALKRVMEK